MKFSLLTLFLLVAFVGFSQKAVVANRKSIPFYAGLEEELIVALDGYKATDLEVTVNRGKVKKHNGRFIYYPDSAGRATFTLFKLIKGKRIEVASFVYPVKNIYPPPVDLSIGGVKEGKIYKSRLEIHPGVECYYDFSEFGFCCIQGLKPVLRSYRLLIMRKDQLIFSGEMKDAKFTDEVKAVFKTLQIGDKLYFVDVKVTSYSGGKLVNKPFELEVTSEERSAETNE